jgi:hypothetical protein
MWLSSLFSSIDTSILVTVIAGCEGPAGRTEKTISEGTTKATVVNHYPGPGEAISWICEENAKECEEGKAAKWTRDIPGIDGSLAATQHDSEAAVLQLHDLQGNIVATAAVSETETKLLTTYNPTEFGVPVNGTPPTKYSWLGASGYTAEQSSGAANPGGGSYVPQLGRPLQTEPTVPPGSPTMMYVSTQPERWDAKRRDRKKPKSNGKGNIRPRRLDRSHRRAKAERSRWEALRVGPAKTQPQQIKKSRDV